LIAPPHHQVQLLPADAIQKLLTMGVQFQLSEFQLSAFKPPVVASRCDPEVIDYGSSISAFRISAFSF
jgi:hypothetical protein